MHYDDNESRHLHAFLSEKLQNIQPIPPEVMEKVSEHFNRIEEIIAPLRLKPEKTPAELKALHELKEKLDELRQRIEDQKQLVLYRLTLRLLDTYEKVKADAQQGLPEAIEYLQILEPMIRELRLSNFSDN